MVGFGQTGLESMDLEMASPEEIIANVERMIKQEETKNTAMKKEKRSAEKALDLLDYTRICKRCRKYEEWGSKQGC